VSVRDLLAETLRSLRAHALRFLLTSLGVAWGALLLTFLSAQMGGVRTHFMTEIEELGPKLVFMGAGVILENRVGERGSRRVELDAEDVARVESLDSVERATPNLQLYGQPVRRGRRTKLLNVMGWDQDAEVMRNFRAAEGRFLSALDVERGTRVAFLGPEAKERLFGREPALGGWIQIGSQRFQVVGIAEPKGEQLSEVGNRDDLMVIVPYTTAMRWLQASDRVEEFMLAPRDRELGGLAIRQVRQLTGLHRDFAPTQETALWSADMWDTLKVIYGMFYALQGFFIVAGTVTLLVGAVGVMNIMLVVVGERTAEIGLRKALGARGRDVFVQFLLEAVAVAGAAGGLGVAGGLLLLRATAPAFAAAGIYLPTTPDLLTTGAVTVALVLVAIVAGVVPAVRASRIPPAEALRAY
jgi:putative ABC transport system permease protein